MTARRFVMARRPRRLAKPYSQSRMRDPTSFGRSRVSTDTLSVVLRAVRLTGAVFFRIEGGAPWVAEAPPAAVVAPYVLPASEHVVEYHVITSGSCWASIVGGEPV